MRISSLSILPFVAILGACDDDEPGEALEARITALEEQRVALEARIAALEPLAARVAALEGQSAALATDVGTLSTQVDELTTDTDGAAELLALMRAEGGDVIVEGANLYVRSGAGATRGTTSENGSSTVNGKGNLIIGYNEQRGECVGGARNGRPCTFEDGYYCPDGTCDLSSPGPKTGSHNLVIGAGHSYTGYGSIVAGLVNSVEANQAAVLGGEENSVTRDRCLIVGGRVNTCMDAGAFSVVLGGRTNTMSHTASVILGGVGTSSSASDQIVP